ncbi:hypothetical protein DAPPUDRAFT_94686 [Daphnia pulex]|uniref:Uncharacterized protein n=1 Tax=Daphnia pulex TaxID=6669 RepID=E9FSR8_DAPPU|nr:hypothetical protein DAPPUDRAFT_94686 [Daphnia pulex]|eukprot:EFX89774.1 hypothetical protein DAPPUDRAFT_94686 [Daphnia pulex]
MYRNRLIVGRESNKLNRKNVQFVFILERQPVSNMMKRRIVVAPRRIVWTLDCQPSQVFVMPKRKEKKRCEKWRKFAGRSTCAAVAHLGEESHPLPVKIVWRITLIVGIFLTTVSTYFSASSFVNFAGNSEMVLQANSDSWIEHPNYHICTSNTFNSTILKEMGFVDAEMVSYLILTTSVFIVSPALVDDVERQRQLEIKFNKMLVDKGIKDVKEIFQRAVLKCEDIIAGCISPGVYVDGVDCCAKYFPTGSFASSTGACVTTFSTPPIIQINDEDIMTSVVSRKVCAHRNDHERYRHLVPGFGNYTEENCNFAVRQKRVTEYANCYMMNLPYKGDLPPCRPQQMLILDQLAKTEMNLNIGELDCVSECWKETYEFSASYADLELTTNFRFGNWSISPNQRNFGWQFRPIPWRQYGDCDRTFGLLLQLLLFYQMNRTRNVHYRKTGG